VDEQKDVEQPLKGLEVPVEQGQTTFTEPEDTPMLESTAPAQSPSQSPPSPPPTTTSDSKITTDAQLQEQVLGDVSYTNPESGTGEEGDLGRAMEKAEEEGKDERKREEKKQEEEEEEDEMVRKRKREVGDEGEGEDQDDTHAGKKGRVDVTEEVEQGTGKPFHLDPLSYV
jgi:hypothetical protein